MLDTILIWFANHGANSIDLLLFIFAGYILFCILEQVFQNKFIIFSAMIRLVLVVCYILVYSHIIEYLQF